MALAGEDVWMANRPLRLMIAKPTLRCTANCLGCASRRELHRSALKERHLSFEQWKAILSEGVALGLQHLEISGGEPTLYEDLVPLVREAKNRGLWVKMNTNGSMITPDYARELLDAGLDMACLSIYSHDPEVHNNFRRSKGLWEKAVRAAHILGDLRETYPHFHLYTQTILLRENMPTFDRLFRLHHELGSEIVIISYLEGDFEGNYLPTEREIDLFRRDVVPRLVAACETLDPRCRDDAIRTVEGLYGPVTGTPADLARGIYWQRGNCSISRESALILASGEVHPCNIVEYTHEPVMGNLFEQRLSEIWNSSQWEAYRQNLHEQCPRCPMNVHTAVALQSPPAISPKERGVVYRLYRSRWVDPVRPMMRPLVRRVRAALAVLRSDRGGGG
jgi:MoaA/NifB/PqqE/SkfB family radical SAM enzyme